MKAAEELSLEARVCGRIDAMLGGKTVTMQDHAHEQW